MHNFKELLLSKSFRTVHGTEFNQVYSSVREMSEPPLLIYEIVLEDDQTWDYMKNKVYPFLARYLKHKGLNPSSGSGFVVALFFKDFAHFLKGKDFFKAFCEMEGLNSAGFRFRVLKWLSE
jgi:hypothetical protein